MNIIKRKEQSSSINQKIRRAEFVTSEGEQKETFKYKLLHKVKSALSTRLSSLKRSLLSKTQKANLLLAKFDWKKIREDASIVALEVVLEGSSANFATHMLFGYEFSVAMIIAHGIIIKQGISIYWRLKKHGASVDIPQKD